MMYPDVGLLVGGAADAEDGDKRMAEAAVDAAAAAAAIAARRTTFFCVRSKSGVERIAASAAAVATLYSWSSLSVVASPKEAW
jgi:hypothetical protein